MKTLASIAILLTSSILLVHGQDTCSTQSGEYKSEPGCDSTDGGFNCGFYASWNLDSDSDEIQFTLKSTQESQDTWIGIGFSDTQGMASTDIVSGYMNGDNQAVIEDRWAPTYFTTVDSSQDLSETSGTYVDGVLTIQFTRPRQTGDDRDVQFTDTECFYFMYAYGPVFFGDIRKHEESPVVTGERICIKSCPGPTTPTTTTTTTPPPTTVTISRTLRFTSLNYTDDLADETSTEYTSLKVQMEAEILASYVILEAVMENDLLVEVVVTGFSAGSVIVDYDVTISNDNGITSQLEESVQVAWEDAILANDGKLSEDSELDVDTTGFTNAPPASSNAAETITALTVVGVASVVAVASAAVVAVKRCFK